MMQKSRPKVFLFVKVLNTLYRKEFDYEQRIQTWLQTQIFVLYHLIFVTKYRQQTLTSQNISSDVKNLSLQSTM